MKWQGARELYPNQFVKFDVKKFLSLSLLLVVSFLIVAVQLNLLLIFFNYVNSHLAGIFFFLFSQTFFKSLFYVLFSIIQVALILKISSFSKSRLNMTIVIYSIFQIIISLLISLFLFYYTSYSTGSMIIEFNGGITIISLSNIVISILLKYTQKNRYYEKI